MMSSCNFWSLPKKDFPISHARYFDGKKYIPLPGFSLAGSIYEDLKKVEFSNEQTLTPNYSGPKYMIFKGLEIS